MSRSESASPVKQSLLSVGGATFELTRVSGEESLSTPFRYELVSTVHLDEAAPPKVSALVGSAASLTMIDALGHRRTVTGVLGEASVVYPELGVAHVRAALVPTTHAMTLGSTSRADHDATVVDVAVDRLTRAGAAPALEITGTYATKPYRVQRGESDWGYALRTIASEGIYLYFDHDAASRPVLADDSRGARPIAGQAVIPFVHASALSGDTEAVTELASARAMKPGRVSGRSFDWKNPSLGLSHDEGGGAYEAYDSRGGGPTSPDTMKATVGLAADSGAAATSGSGGVARTIRIFPGRSFAVAGHPGGLDGEWIVTAVSVTSESGDDRTFLTRFSAAPKGERTRATPAVPTPKQAGLALGTVAADAGDEVFPDAHARVRVQMHWDREGAKDAKSGTWMRVGQRNTPASMLFPRAGWHVATLHEEGDVDSPWVLSRIHDGERPPTYALPANMTRVVYKTATTPGGGSHNEIHFEDAIGREEVFWNATKDLVVHTEERKKEQIDRDATHEVGRDQRIQTGESWGQDVKQDQVVEIGANERITVGAARARNVTGSDESIIGGSRTLKVDGAADRTVRGSRKLQVGAAQIDISLGNIGNDSKLSSVLVGAASLKVSRGNVTEETNKVGLTAVGVAKVELSKRSVSTDVGKELVETIGGDVTNVSKGRYLDTNGKTGKHVVLGAVTVSAKKEIRLEASETITLQCGASVARITDQGIEVSSDHVSLDGNSIDTQTLKIQHNG
ncbi:MAG TPA: type VI secretion system tip protein TssI/VgrG [Polyangiaceae bacterium]|nr:type VI secretion system tip protein TssI/VgrG [Polyangiaceae bacterium]